MSSSGIPVDARYGRSHGPYDMRPKRLGPKYAGLDVKEARRRRLRATVRVHARRVETALDKLRSRAARALTPDPAGALARRAAVREAEQEVRELDADGRVFTRRDTGAQVRTRDTLAAADPVLIAGRAADDRYEVECLTHRGDPLFFDDAGAAARAARRSHMWCEGCRQLGQALRPVRGRARIRTRTTLTTRTAARALARVHTRAARRRSNKRS
ncbi:hypothetical protein [Streptomyces cavernicola]|uniref:Uncharacterized protein n=1 Tax=Streptomyces cavernicola TaxID=3043613 RepID=A0ABT6SIQ7_9ACTN|nr:hypothetical protein [Streptomyces sp. B-S-A6]MDI3407557.1 hypothetical protein [Streptomyces sp. B-S-A6]